MLENGKRQALDAMLEERCREANIPGMALAVMKDGELLYEKYEGFRDVERRLPVDRDTVFGTASITKSLASLAVMLLAGEGKLSPDDTVSGWLPELELPEPHRQSLRVHHLMSHTGGFPGMDAIHRARAESIRRDRDGAELFDELEGLEDVQPIRIADELIRVINDSGFNPAGLPGEVFNYSNESYGLLQAVIERASGEGFIPFAKSRILEPLGMTRSVFTEEELEELGNVTELYAYRRDGSGAVFHSPAWWDVGGIYANGSLKSSAADLLKFLELFRQEGWSGSRCLLSSEAVREMTASHATIPLGGGYGYGFQTGTIGGIDTFGHGGGIKGVSSHMKVVPAYGLSVVVLLNIADAPAEPLARSVIQELLDLEEEKRAQTQTLTHGEGQELAGAYQSGEGQSAEFVWEEDRLLMKSGEEKLELRFVGEGLFELAAGERVKFMRNKEGAVHALFKGMRVLPKKPQGD